MPFGSQWWNTRRELAAIASMVILVGLAYGFLLKPDSIPYSPHSDLIAQHLAMKDVAYRSLQAGNGLPFWKSDQLSGGPALTHPQALYTHPLQILFLLLSPADAAGPTLWLHFLATALSYWLLGAALRLGPWARALMAVAGLFQFKLILITYAGWLPVIPIVSTAPLLFATVLRVLEQPSTGRCLALAAVGALCLHSGHLQIFYYAVILLAPYLILRLVVEARGATPQRARALALGSLLAALLASCLAAYLLVPLAAEAGLTSRVGASYDFFLAGRPFWAGHLLTFLHPEILGSPLNGSYAGSELWEDVAYFGAVPELLAIAGAVLGWRRHHGRFLVVAFAASLLLSLDTPLTRLLFELLPGFDLFRSPRRMLFLTSLLGIALAGIGAEELLGRVARGARGAATAHGLAALLLVTTAAEGLYYAHRYLEVRTREEVMPATRYQRFFAADPSRYRIAPFHWYTINYGWAAPMDLELITGFDAYNYRHYQDYFTLLAAGETVDRDAPVWTDLDGVRRWDLLDALNVKYLVTSETLGFPPAGLRLAASFGDEPSFVFYNGLTTRPVYVYENERAHPRAYWARSTLHTSSREQALEAMSTQNLGQRTVVEGPEPPASPGPPEPDDSVTVDTTRAGHLILHTRSTEERFVVISEVWHPGWRLTIDGERASLERSNVALMGAWVPAGSHELRLEFRPLHWPLALGLSLCAGVLFGLMLIREWRQRWRRGPIGPTE